MNADGTASAKGSAPPGFCLEALDFNDIDGWAEDDHIAALAAFAGGARVLADHPPKPRASGVPTGRLVELIRQAADYDLTDDAAARKFFEDGFQPYAVVPEGSRPFFTGYYEPIVAGARTPSRAFPHPIYARPDDLVDIDPDRPPPGIPPGTRFGRRNPDESLSSYPDRGSIQAGALADRGLELVYLADPVDVFFIHVQGSARIRLIEGGDMRITYAAKSGHPYTPIGRVLIEMGALPPGGATMTTIRQWLAANPDQALAVMARNRSYIFFREAPVTDADLGPVAAAKVPLTPGRSLAVDRLIHSFHTPVWVDARLPGDKPFRHLMVAHDTGSAIVGPARGDIFVGSGDDAGETAGALQSTGRFIALFPRPE